MGSRSQYRIEQNARALAQHRYRRKLAIRRLQELEYIRKVGNRLTITKNGRGAMSQTVQQTRRALKTRHWDNKWRIVIFDIPEKYAALRNKVRAILKRAGFARLQHSVWVFPHDCPELAKLLREDQRLSDYVLFGVLEKFEGDKNLQKMFGFVA